MALDPAIPDPPAPTPVAAPAEPATPAAPPTGSELASPMAAAPASGMADPRWLWPAFAGVLALAAVLYLVNLTVSGWANTYYSAAAQAASQSWSAWFFGSFDAASFITVDKPPLSTMLMGLSVRLLGLSPFSVLLPEALCGIATVAVVMVAVRRQLGPLAAIVAGVVAALTPAAVLMFRYNNPDALLTLLMAVAALALVRGLETGAIRWAVLAAVLVGFGFNTKSLQAFLVLPGFALTWALCAPGSFRRRLSGLLAAGAAALASSAWWVVTVDLLPRDSRPYIGGSDTNSALELVFGYNGLARIFGRGGPGGANAGPVGAAIAGPGGGGPSFSGTPGLLRLFNEELGGQVAWLLPLAGLALIAGLLLHARSGRSNPRFAAYVLWGSWLAVHAIVFSFMSGIIHSYYTVAMAPAIGALAGGGVADLWRLRWRWHLGGIPLAAGIAGTAALGSALLGRTPAFATGLDTWVLVVALAAALVVAVPSISVSPSLVRIQVGAAALGLAALLAGPAAYAAATMQRDYSGGDPAAGPMVPRSGPGGGFVDGGLPGGGQLPGGQLPGGQLPGGQLPGGGQVPGRGGQLPGGQLPGGQVGPPPSGVVLPNGVQRPGGQGAGGGLANGGVGSALVQYLLDNRGSATWIVAANGSQEAGAIQLSAGEPVMAMGGFNGSDPAPSLDQLKAYVASGKLRFVITGGGQGNLPGGRGATGINQWVVSACRPVTIAGTAVGNLYDCQGAR